ncbi:hypothetical protein MLD38_010187 [Melastoma candidum]|uniref:Uncharacterized protein n=1 Tax=Melastoma candidum TaxID=119954 RepID=A0ACB9R0V2_9MYRT|nr:hypothetical protein MLD38_010187 [Melastoma candidum]
MLVYRAIILNNVAENNILFMMLSKSKSSSNEGSTASFSPATNAPETIAPLAAYALPPKPLAETVMLEQYNGLNGEKYIRKRNRPLTNEELDGMSLHEGYKKLESPVSYVSSGTPARKILASPTPMATPPYVTQQLDVTKEAIGSFPFMKPKGY